jgi:hypothetical protein
MVSSAVQGVANVTVRRSFKHAPLHRTSAFLGSSTGQPIPRKHPTDFTAARVRTCTEIVASRTQASTDAPRRLSASAGSYEILSERSFAPPAATPDPLSASKPAALERVNSGLSSQGTWTDATSLRALSGMARTCSHSASLRGGASTPLPTSGGIRRPAGASPVSGRSSGRLQEEPDGAGAGREDDEAVLMRVPVASRKVASRLIKQRRAVNERARATGRAWGSPCSHYSTLQPQSENVPSLRTVRLARTGSHNLKSASAAASTHNSPAGSAKNGSFARISDAAARADALATVVAPPDGLNSARGSAGLTSALSISSDVSEAGSEASRRSARSSRRRAAALAGSIEVLSLTGRASPKGPWVGGARSRWGSVIERPAATRSTGLHSSFTSPFFTADNTGFSGGLDDGVAVGNL